ncbi:MAG: SRPBCC domain-containing protein [Streptosporangiaceae bacterium]
MELEHSFSVPVPVERAWNVLLDVQRVAPCMPGATLDSVDGDAISGRIKVKVGPIQMTYAGTAKFTERDEAAHVVVLDASGKETRGAGTAAASVRSELTADGDATRVTVHTTLNVTGKPAQFGRGVLTEVGGRLVGIFADNLAAMLAAEPAPAAPAAPEPAAQPSGGSEAGHDTGTTDEEALPIDVLNLSSRAWSSLRKDGVQTLGDLTRRTAHQLLAIDGVGPASVTDIRSKLAERGLALVDAPGQDATPGRHAADREELAAVTPLRSPRHEATQPATAPRESADFDAAGWQPPDNEAIDLLGVAGLPVIKRAVPAVAALVAVVLVVFGLRRRRARRS